MKQIIYKFIFCKIFGWKVVGSIAPIVKKCVIIAVPHTSWWDFFLGIFSRGILNIEINSTIIIIGQIVKVHIPEARLAEDGLVKPDDLLLSGGLDAYYSSEFITQLPYAKP